MRKLAILAIGMVSLGLVGCGNGDTSAPDEATLKKKLGNGPPSMASAGQHKGARERTPDAGAAPAGGG